MSVDVNDPDTVFHNDMELASANSMQPTPYAHSLIHLFTHLRPHSQHSITNSLTNSFTRALTSLVRKWAACIRTPSLVHSPLIHSLYSFTHLLIHALPHSHKYSHTHSLTQSLTHSLTHVKLLISLVLLCPIMSLLD